MDINNKKEFDLYKDIQNRTNGEVYLGIVGPVRTGKSTFIKRFMELMVLPFMEDVHSKERTIDELPQAEYLSYNPRFKRAGRNAGIPQPRHFAGA